MDTNGYHDQFSEFGLQCWRFIEGEACKCLKDGGQGRNRTADASLFRAALYRLSYLATGKILLAGFHFCQLAQAGGAGEYLAFARRFAENGTLV